MREKHFSSVGMTWDELEEKYYTPEEIAESDAEVAIIGEFIKARTEGKISQKQFEELSGTCQSSMENEYAEPGLSAVLEILASLGKTLVVAPLEVKKLVNNY